MRLYLLIFFMYFTASILAQKKYELKFSTSEYKIIKKNVSTHFKDSIEAKKYINQLYYLAIKSGYLTASIDSCKYQNQMLEVSFFVGDKFEKATINANREDLVWLRKKSNLKEKFIRNISFKPKEIERLLKTIHQSLENNGYPFSKVEFDSIRFIDNQLIADLKITRNRFYQWKEIHIKGDSAISKVALMNLIRIKEGDVFNQTELNLISKRIKQVNYLKEIKTHEILFTKEGAELFVYLKSNAVSSVNGAVGLQPNPVTNKMNFTGDLSLKLVNVIKRGELFEANWKSLQAFTQSLNIHANYPFILNTPFGIDGLFNLYKRDTTFLTTKGNFGIQYFLKGGNYFKVFYQKDVSSVLKGAKNNPDFSNLKSVQTNSYGFTIYRRQIDYVPNPSSGVSIKFEGSAGSRKMIDNEKSDSILKSTTYKFNSEIEFYIPFFKRNVIKLSNQTNSYYAPTVFQNELYRFGGLNSQRGMNEEELFASTSTTFSIEYRFLVDQNSRLFVFFDQSWYENRASKNYYKDLPYGYGLGFSFGTNVGIFSISYAQGKQFDNPVLFRNGKVHFGYVAYF